MLTPLVLRPKLYSIKNRWKRGFDLRSHFGRDIVITIFSIGITIGIYYGCKEVLDMIHTTTRFAYFPPAFPLGALFFMLFLMLLFSNGVSAISAFYLGKDLDLILASPISPWEFFYGKFLEILLSSSWMALAFASPVIAAFGQAYGAGIYFYLTALIVLLPYFIIPSGIAAAIATIFTRMMPANRTRELLLVLFVFALWGMYFLVKLALPSSTSLQNSEDVLYIISFFSRPSTSWLPSHWAATVLGEELVPTGINTGPYLLMLLLSAAAVTSFAFVLLRTFHATCYTMARSGAPTILFQNKGSKRLFTYLGSMLDSQYRAVVSKEIKSFSRDMTQAVQLLLLLGLCVIYLYNFRILHDVQVMNPNAKLWWRGFLVVSNLAMGAFVITAVCSRFVFPSVSLEGQSLWVIQASPMRIGDLLRAKFWCWLVPVATISSIIFGSGALAIHAEPNLVILNAIMSWMISYGIVGLAVGLGAVFANFDWEHPSQLAASFGSLVFMLTSIVLVVVNLIPAAVPIFLRTYLTTGMEMSNVTWYCAMTASASILFYINYKTTAWALSVGENSLLERMK